METLMKGSIVIACMAFFLGLEQIDASSSKIELHEKLGDLWENRKDKSMNFYDFMAKEVLPRQHTLFQGVDTRLPDYLVTAKPGGANFPCQLFHNHSNPTSVHRLKPSDIDYVASLGDSITAAFGAKSRSLLEIFVEFRGVSWSIGGDDSLKHVVTLPNIIKEYYSDVRGFSVKTTPPKIRIPWRSHLNFAVSGAISIDLPGQAERLIRKLKTFDDFEDSWKLLTIWIGGNDLCALCKNDKHTLEKYVGGISDALDMFYNEVPKMFVNLVQIIDVTELALISTPYCKVLHKILCKCGTSAGEEVKAEVKKMASTYWAGVEELINSGRYDDREDFAVVIQPFFTKTKAPLMPDNKTVDMSYFSPDCFHFSEKGHKAAALALWNSMIEPVGKKRLEWAEGEQFECPNKKFPYFFTKKNSEEFLSRSFNAEDSQREEKGTKIGSMNEDSHDRETVGNKAAQDETKEGGKGGQSGLAIIAIVASALVVLGAVVFVTVARGKQRAYEGLQTEVQPSTYNSI